MIVKIVTMRKLLLLVFCIPFMAQAQTNQDSITIKKMADKDSDNYIDLKKKKFVFKNIKKWQMKL